MQETKKTDWLLRHTAFGQLYQQLNRKDPRMRCRVFRVMTNQRAFQVTFRGLNATDAGGPYRELIDTVVNEIHRPVLPFFVPCPNQRSGTGENRDKFVPRPLPANNRVLILSGYELIGQLMGLAMRSGNLLPFNFPSIVWKVLVNDVVTVEDVTAIDALSFQIVTEIKQLVGRKVGLTADAFDTVMADRTFEVYGADQKLYPIVAGGSSMSLSLKNAPLYIEAVNRFRLNEFRPQCEAIRRGLATVVPVAVLNTFTWRELEKLVVGGTFDVDLLKQNTVYEGISESQPHVALFWRMMRERFDDPDRFRFLQFVWGRSRMPTSNITWGDKKFKITSYGRTVAGDVNKALPISHTCFFSVEMPMYTSLDAMTSRIRLAMDSTGVIDGDSSSTHEQIRMNADDGDEGGSSLY